MNICLLPLVTYNSGGPYRFAPRLPAERPNATSHHTNPTTGIKLSKKNQPLVSRSCSRRTDTAVPT